MRLAYILTDMAQASHSGFMIHMQIQCIFFKFSCRTSKSYYRLKINNPTELEPRWLKYNDIDKSVLNLSSVLKAFWYYNASQFDTAYESTP
jgi:hypothetical protein